MTLAVFHRSPGTDMRLSGTHIERAASAESNHGVTLAFAEHAGRFDIILLDGVGVNGGEEFPSRAVLGRAERGAEKLEGARAEQASIRDHERAAYLQSGQASG